MWIALALTLGISNASAAPKSAPPAAPADVDTGVLDMQATPEERSVYGDLPAAPETGAENPEDLLKSSPMTQKKSASAKGAMPAKLREIPPSQADRLAPEAITEIPTDQTQEIQPTAETPPTAEPLPEAVVPAEPEQEVAAVTDSDASSTKHWDRSIPMYDREKPNWAWDFHGSLHALGSTDFASPDGAGNVVEYDTGNFGLGFHWEPEALQGAGVFSVGLTGNVYILSHSNDVRDAQGDLTSGPFSIFGLGVSAQYQFNYWRGQPFVPYIGFEAQQIHYKFADYSDLGEGWTLSTGPVFGAMLLLNWMEPSAAHSLWSETSVKRTYLVGEFKMLTAGLSALSVDGSALYFGLRMEY